MTITGVNAWAGRDIFTFGDSFSTFSHVNYPVNGWLSHVAGETAVTRSPVTKVWADGTRDGTMFEDYNPGGRWYDSYGAGVRTKYQQVLPDLTWFALGVNECWSFNKPSSVYRTNMFALATWCRSVNPNTIMVFAHQPGCTSNKGSLWLEYWWTCLEAASTFGNAIALDWSIHMPWGDAPWPGITTHNTDHVHPNDTGQRIMGATAMTLLNALS